MGGTEWTTGKDWPCWQQQVTTMRAIANIQYTTAERLLNMITATKQNKKNWFLQISPEVGKSHAHRDTIIVLSRKGIFNVERKTCL